VPAGWRGRRRGATAHHCLLAGTGVVLPLLQRLEELHDRLLLRRLLLRIWPSRRCSSSCLHTRCCNSSTRRRLSSTRHDSSAAASVARVKCIYVSRLRRRLPLGRNPLHNQVFRHFRCR
jgi:hypothetical protein